jgi:hypothetical protein
MNDVVLEQALLAVRAILKKQGHTQQVLPASAEEMWGGGGAIHQKNWKIEVLKA